MDRFNFNLPCFTCLFNIQSDCGSGLRFETVLIYRRDIQGGSHGLPARPRSRGVRARAVRLLVLLFNDPAQVELDRNGNLV